MMSHHCTVAVELCEVVVSDAQVVSERSKENSEMFFYSVGTVGIFNDVKARATRPENIASFDRNLDLLSDYLLALKYSYAW